VRGLLVNEIVACMLTPHPNPLPQGERGQDIPLPQRERRQDIPLPHEERGQDIPLPPRKGGKWDNHSMNTTSPSMVLAIVFALFVAVEACIKLWLAGRQAKFVQQHRAQVPGVFAGKVSLDAHQKAADYTAAKMQFSMVNILLGTTVLMGWTLLGGLDWLNQTLISAIGTGMWQQLALLIAFIAIGGLIDLPLSWYSQFRLEAKFGFNRMDLKTFVMDTVKGAVLGLVIMLPLAWVVLTLMAKAGGLWWFYAWAVWAAFSLAMMIVFPTYIAPLFNKFSPLDDAGLKERVSSLMQRTGFTAKGFFVMDGSKRSAHANAYFTGLGASKRVVFFDTLLSKLNGQEVEAVLAHELGHFKHKHVTKRLVLMMGSSLLGLALLGYLSQQLWFYFGLGVTPTVATSAAGSGNEAVALLLFMMAAPVFMFALSPISAYFSRKQEFEADAFAVANADGRDLVQALVKLFEDNASTLTPDPLFVKWYYSHPPAAERFSRIEAQLARS
jgi:STE24 endopeptidase